MRAPGARLPVDSVNVASSGVSVPRFFAVTTFKVPVAVCCAVPSAHAMVAKDARSTDGLKVMASFSSDWSLRNVMTVF